MMQQSRGNSYLFGGNAAYVEELYESYLDNPGSVSDQWRNYFDQMQHVPAADGSQSPDVAHAPIVQSFAQRAKEHRLTPPNASADGLARKQVYVQQLIAAYRYLGCALGQPRSAQASGTAVDSGARTSVLRLCRGRSGHHLSGAKHLFRF
jgi:2-oxoglutarate dehydrogenase complex dehydrogenase (E1) component-like enzyme